MTVSTSTQELGREETRGDWRSLRLYCLLSSMMMIYKGSTTMYKTTLNHHLYRRFLHNILTTNLSRLTATDNSSWIPNICYPNQSIKTDRDFAQELADKHQTLLLSVASSISLVTLIIFGLLSDSLGRKFILISATLAFSVQCSVVAVFIQNGAGTSMYYIPYVIDGLGGSMFGFNLGCFLVMADTVRSKRERALGLALIEGLNGVGSITTEFSTVYLVKRYGVTLPIILASVSVMMVLIMVSVCLPRRTVSLVKTQKDSIVSSGTFNQSQLTIDNSNVTQLTRDNINQSQLTRDHINQSQLTTDNINQSHLTTDISNQSETSACNFNQSGQSIDNCNKPEQPHRKKESCYLSLKKFLNTFIMFYVSNRYYGKRKIFCACLVMFCLVESPIVFRSDLIALIQIGWPNCWSTSLANDYIYIGLALNYILAMVMIIPFQYCLSDPTIAMLGIVSAIAFNVTTAFADSKDLYFCGLAMGTFMIIPKPIIRSIASRRAGPKHQGALFAGFLAAELLSEVISEMVFKFVYAHNHGPVDGTIFFFIGGALCIALGLAIYLRDVTKKERSIDRSITSEVTPINSPTG